MCSNCLSKQLTLLGLSSCVPAIIGFILPEITQNKTKQIVANQQKTACRVAANGKQESSRLELFDKRFLFGTC